VISHKFSVKVLALFLFWTLLSLWQVMAATPAAKIGAQSQSDDQQRRDSRGDDQMVYTFQGTATGEFQLGDEPAKTFESQAFTIVVTANPGDVSKSASESAVPSGTCTILTLPVTSATISVGGSRASIQSPIAVFDNQTYATLGLTRQPMGDFLNLSRSKTFETYELREEVRPKEVFFKNETPAGQFNCAFRCLVTSMGNLNMKWVQNVTFTAVRSEEPQLATASR